VGLSEFHDTFATIILHFSGNIGDGHCHGEISLIRRRRPPVLFFRLLIFAYSSVLIKALSW
jgi:hypothetical protein